MKRVLIAALLLAMMLLPGAASAAKPAECTAIKDGVLTYSAGHYLEGQPLTIGFDIYGYNYQAHMFKGSYANAYLGRYGFPPYEGDAEAYLEAYPAAENSWVWPYRDDHLMMKWNDAWLSNKDCDGDGALDRMNGQEGYIGSGAWLTNHTGGEYLCDATGEMVKWNDFVKIVAVQDDAYLLPGSWLDPWENEYTSMWYAADDTEIGPEIWGAFAITQEISNDPCLGAHGAFYISPMGPGFGQFAP